MVPDERMPLRLPRSVVGPVLCVLAAGLVWASCSSEEAPPAEALAEADEEYADFPPTAVIPTVRDLRASRDAPKHPTDGGGRAFLVDGPTEVTISTRHAWTIAYEAGPLGVPEGGVVFFMPSPFWGWDDAPQTSVPGAPGYTEVSTDAEGVTLEPLDLGEVLRIRIGGRDLAEGERITIVYGAGGAGAIADKYGERRSTLWLAVDGDGDGSRSFLAECPEIDVLPAYPAGLWMTVPTVAEKGAEARVTVALLDPRGNAWVDWSGDVVLEPVEGLELPERVTIAPEDRATAAFDVRASETGLYRLRASLDPPLPQAPEDHRYESNPMLVSESATPVLWADLHGHSQLSDGTGTPEDYFRYARDVAALDVVALTDHDHWGVRFLDEHPEKWETIQRVTKKFHEPGRFVTLLGYEWTSWIYGHRHVLYFQDEGELHSSMDPATEDPGQLWDALRGEPAMTFAHHSAGGPIATDWSFAPDPVLEPVTEIMSVHGSSEASDSPQRIYSSVPGNFARDVLQRGYRLGFLGSGDSHDGHPGLPQLAGAFGGLAAILADEPTRESVLEALRARRVYATNGERILLRASLGGHRMGSTIPADEAGTLELRAHVVGTGPISTLEVILPDESFEIDCGRQEEVALPPLPLELASGDWVYLRVQQANGGLAWSSPFFVD